MLVPILAGLAGLACMSNPRRTRQRRRRNPYDEGRERRLADWRAYLRRFPFLRSFNYVSTRGRNVWLDVAHAAAVAAANHIRVCKRRGIEPAAYSIQKHHEAVRTALAKAKTNPRPRHSERRR